jgi:ABC1 atypical kinase-like domain
MRLSSVLLQVIVVVGIWNEHDNANVVAFSPSQLHRAAAVLVDTTSSVLENCRKPFSRIRSAQDDAFWSRSSVPTFKTVLDATVMDEQEVTPSNATVDVNIAAVTELSVTLSPKVSLPGTIELVEQQDALLQQIEAQAVQIVEDMMDESCEVDPDTGAPADDICVDEEKKRGFRATVKDTIQRTSKLVAERGLFSEEDDVAMSRDADRSKRKKVLSGDVLEKGWETRANASALARNAEVWKFALQSVFRVLKPRKLRKKGALDEEVKTAQIAAAEFIRDGLLELGPSFVKLGQVMSTRTDVLPATYTDVLKTLTDEVPGFDGRRAKEIVSKELGRPCDEVFTNFSREPIKAASLGQVHTAVYNGQKVAVKVQRAGLKELFDLDLKNLKKVRFSVGRKIAYTYDFTHCVQYFTFAVGHFAGQI